MKAGQKLVVLSAMKMETAVQSPCDGLVRHVGVDKGDSLEAGERPHCRAVVHTTVAVQANSAQAFCPHCKSYAC